MSKIIKISQLRQGDRFSFIPAAWHGPGVVRESYESGNCWCIKFDNSKVVNPPGVIYAKRETSASMKKFYKNHGMSGSIVKEMRVRLLGRN